MGSAAFISLPPSVFAAVWIPPAVFIQQWLGDPEAVTTFFVALVGGGFALYKFRSIPSERRRATLEAMQETYGASSTDRAAILHSLPPYLKMGRQAVEDAVKKAGPARSDLTSEFRSWESLTATAAHEIKDSEAKFRSLLWVVQELYPRLRELNSPTTEEHVGLAGELKVARGLVNKLNNFAQMVELNLFPQEDVLGQLHRSIAPACKAVEPLIWSQNASGGRWGLRVPRLLLRAEHFNEVRRIHRMGKLAWRRQDGSEVLIQSALYRSDFGRPIPTDRLRRMSWWRRRYIDCEDFLLRLRPRYGGQRLRKHMHAENELIGWLRFAYESNWDALDVEGWNRQKLEARLARHWDNSG